MDPTSPGPVLPGDGTTPTLKPTHPILPLKSTTPPVSPVSATAAAAPAAEPSTPPGLDRHISYSIPNPLATPSPGPPVSTLFPDPETVPVLLIHFEEETGSVRFQGATADADGEEEAVPPAAALQAVFDPSAPPVDLKDLHLCIATKLASADLSRRASSIVWSQASAESRQASQLRSTGRAHFARLDADYGAQVFARAADMYETAARVREEAAVGFEEAAVGLEEAAGWEERAAERDGGVVGPRAWMRAVAARRDAGVVREAAGGLRGEAGWARWEAGEARRRAGGWREEEEEEEEDGGPPGLESVGEGGGGESGGSEGSGEGGEGGGGEEGGSGKERDVREVFAGREDLDEVDAVEGDPVGWEDRDGRVRAWVGTRGGQAGELGDGEGVTPNRSDEDEKVAAGTGCEALEMDDAQSAKAGEPTVKEDDALMAEFRALIRLIIEEFVAGSPDMPESQKVRLVELYVGRVPRESYESMTTRCYLTDSESESESDVGEGAVPARSGEDKKAAPASGCEALETGDGERRHAEEAVRTASESGESLDEYRKDVRFLIDLIVAGGRHVPKLVEALVELHVEVKEVIGARDLLNALSPGPGAGTDSGDCEGATPTRAVDDDKATSGDGCEALEVDVAQATKAGDPTVREDQGSLAESRAKIRTILHRYVDRGSEVSESEKALLVETYVEVREFRDFVAASSPVPDLDAESGNAEDEGAASAEPRSAANAVQTATEYKGSMAEYRAVVETLIDLVVGGGSDVPALVEVLVELYVESRTWADVRGLLDALSPVPDSGTDSGGSEGADASVEMGVSETNLGSLVGEEAALVAMSDEESHEEVLNDTVVPANISDQHSTADSVAAGDAEMADDSFYVDLDEVCSLEADAASRECDGFSAGRGAAWVGARGGEAGTDGADCVEEGQCEGVMAVGGEGEQVMADGNEGSDVEEADEVLEGVPTVMTWSESLSALKSRVQHVKDTFAAKAPDMPRSEIHQLTATLEETGRELELLTASAPFVIGRDVDGFVAGGAAEMGVGSVVGQVASATGCEELLNDREVTGTMTFASCASSAKTGEADDVGLVNEVEAVTLAPAICIDEGRMADAEAPEDDEGAAVKVEVVIGREASTAGDTGLSDCEGAGPTRSVEEKFVSGAGCTALEMDDAQSPKTEDPTEMGSKDSESRVPFRSMIDSFAAMGPNVSESYKAILVNMYVRLRECGESFAARYHSSGAVPGHAEEAVQTTTGFRNSAAEYRAEMTTMIDMLAAGGPHVPKLVEALAEHYVALSEFRDIRESHDALLSASGLGTDLDDGEGAEGAVEMGDKDTDLGILEDEEPALLAMSDEESHEELMNDTNRAEAMSFARGAATTSVVVEPGYVEAVATGPENGSFKDKKAGPEAAKVAETAEIAKAIELVNAKTVLHAGAGVFTVDSGLVETAKGSVAAATTIAAARERDSRLGDLAEARNGTATSIQGNSAVAKSELLSTVGANHTSGMGSMAPLAADTAPNCEKSASLAFGEVFNPVQAGMALGFSNMPGSSATMEATEIKPIAASFDESFSGVAGPSNDVKVPTERNEASISIRAEAEPTAALSEAGSWRKAATEKIGSDGEEVVTGLKKTVSAMHRTEAAHNGMSTSRKDSTMRIAESVFDGNVAALMGMAETKGMVRVSTPPIIVASGTACTAATTSFDKAPAVEHSSQGKGKVEFTAICEEGRAPTEIKVATGSDDIIGGATKDCVEGSAVLPAIKAAKSAAVATDLLPLNTSAGPTSNVACRQSTAGRAANSTSLGPPSLASQGTTSAKKKTEAAGGAASTLRKDAVSVNTDSARGKKVVTTVMPEQNGRISKTPKPAAKLATRPPWNSSPRVGPSHSPSFSRKIGTLTPTSSRATTPGASGRSSRASIRAEMAWSRTATPNSDAGRPERDSVVSGKKHAVTTRVVENANAYASSRPTNSAAWSTVCNASTSPNRRTTANSGNAGGARTSTFAVRVETVLTRNDTTAAKNTEKGKKAAIVGSSDAAEVTNVDSEVVEEEYPPGPSNSASFAESFTRNYAIGEENTAPQVSTSANVTRTEAVDDRATTTSTHETDGRPSDEPSLSINPVMVVNDFGKEKSVAMGTGATTTVKNSVGPSRIAVKGKGVVAVGDSQEVSTSSANIMLPSEDTTSPAILAPAATVTSRTTTRRKSTAGSASASTNVPGPSDKTSATKDAQLASKKKAAAQKRWK
ncbi:hypothetical protein HDU96_004902 [Phlyctochytrium bullatum]|nr:hypothetical protein HDU96_004902 [Phlyctochytrium bullatum]